MITYSLKLEKDLGAKVQLDNYLSKLINQEYKGLMLTPDNKYKTVYDRCSILLDFNDYKRLCFELSSYDNNFMNLYIFDYNYLDHKFQIKCDVKNFLSSTISDGIDKYIEKYPKSFNKPIPEPIHVTVLKEKIKEYDSQIRDLETKKLDLQNAINILQQEETITE